jgi:hypothetical protein
MVGCAGVTALPTDSEEGEDFECPNIESIPVSSPQIIGTDIVVTASVTDEPSGVLSVVLYYKLETSIVWKNEPMVVSTGSTYGATIPAVDVENAAGMHYYIWAQDGSPNLNDCTLPNDGEEGPFHFTLDDAPDKKG